MMTFQKSQGGKLNLNTCYCFIINVESDAIAYFSVRCGRQEDIRLAFLNISRIMDCVGCFKCRLWGKVQVSQNASVTVFNL